MSSKDDTIQFEGTVTDVLPGALCRVQLDGVGKEIIGYISGKMKKNNIRVVVGDRVEIEMSPYDLEKGRITRRN
jgi:translation initiation factor IF-1